MTIVLKLYTVKPGYFKLSEDKKNRSKQTEFEKAYNSWLRSKSKGNGSEFEITGWKGNVAEWSAVQLAISSPALTTN